MNEENEIILDDISEDDTQEETRETKTESVEAKRARLQRQLSQLDKKLGIKDEKQNETVAEKKEGLDRIDKAILRAEKITNSDEIALVQDIMKETGKDIEDVLESRYFKAELKALRDEAIKEDALPSNSKRSMNSNRNSVEYWLAKGEMPPANEPKLRQDYVNARINKTKERHMFSDNPIA